MPKTEIRGFKGPYRFLSNFWEAQITIDGLTFPTSEHAYQAAKSEDPKDWQDVIECVSPGAAKRMGKHLTVRPDWETFKLDAMREVLEHKFSEQHPELVIQLLLTGDAELIEDNAWGDTYWGVCNGRGNNILGKMLMQLRSKLLSEWAVFVFGSNLRGHHGRGAAQYAADLRGAIPGIGEGLMGSCYALPTKRTPQTQMSIWDVQRSVKLFLDCAEDRPEFLFQVTQVGCGLAGFSANEIAPLFRDAPANCLFDRAWEPYLGSHRIYWGTW